MVSLPIVHRSFWFNEIILSVRWPRILVWHKNLWFFNNQFIPATGVKDSKEGSYSLSGPGAVPGTVKFTEFV